MSGSSVRGRASGRTSARRLAAALRERPARRPLAAAAALLVLFALAYYGSYYDYGFVWTDEGSLVLGAARLLEGQRPYVDTALGYGLLWYYPLVGLFSVTGVHFIAYRLFFLALATATALLALATLARLTHRWWIALPVALAILLVPGTLHKAYIPLLVVGGMFVVSRFAGRDRAASSSLVAGSGLVAAAAFHVRPDVGLVVAGVLGATALAHAWVRAAAGPRRLVALGRSLALFAAGTLVPTLPLVAVARHQGVLGPWGQILFQPVVHLVTTARSLAWAPADFRPLPVGPFVAALAAARGTVPEPAAAGTKLARAPLEALRQGGMEAAFAALSYLPLLGFAAIGVAVAAPLAAKALTPGRRLGSVAPLLLALALLAASTFPQFLVFRPDAAHLSQFMPGYLVLAGACLGWIARLRRRGAAAAAWLAAGLLVAHLALYLGFGLRHAASGSRAMAVGRTEPFAAANGVAVVVSPYESDILETARRVVQERTAPGQPFLCFPYCPGFNVMTDRPSPSRRLYVDDLLLVVEPGWQQRMIEAIETERVPLVVVQDWAINGTEISRFQNWAAEVMRHLEAAYEPAASHGTFTFWVRRVEPEAAGGHAAKAVDSAPTGAEISR